MSRTHKARPSRGAREFGGAVRALREDAGLTGVQLARRAAVDPATLCGIERGHQNPSLATIRRIARGLGVPVGRLFPRG